LIEEDFSNLNTEQHSYRQIFKATSLFGGVQVFNIIISVIKSKFVAVLLGPAGMGISGLLTSTTGFITALTNFGIGTSAVKDVAAASSSGDEIRVSTVVTVLRKLVWITGLLGMILTAILSPWLSEITFGNHKYTFAFIWISVTLLFQQLSTGQLVILQGLRKLQYLAKANIIGAAIGLLISVPVYYIWRLDGIVPVIIVSSLTSMALSWFYASRTKISLVKITARETLLEGKGMLRMGFILSVSSLITLGGSYIVRIYISNKGGVEEVGLYSAGFAIITTYVGMVFSAMSTDYYPRLSAIAHDNIKAKILINQQAEIAILIIAPILAVFLIFINLVVILLYSDKFVAVNEMIQWAALGMYFKAASWPIGFLLLAKGASKVYFWSELVANIYLLVFNIIGYKYFGLNGLGISFLISYIFILIQVFLITKVKYAFSFNKIFYKIVVVQLLIGLFCFGIMKTMVSSSRYIWGVILIVISIGLSTKELDKRIGFLNALKTTFRHEKK
jgi:O-antigen/teichoic acid export membrane protein